MTELTFTDRVSYVEWRSAWRADYARLSEEIRGHKSQRNPAKVGQREASYHQMMREVLRRKAREALDIRTESKIRAGQLRQQQRIEVS